MRARYLCRALTATAVLAATMAAGAKDRIEPLEKRAIDLAVREPLVYVAASAGLVTYDVSQPESPRRVGRFTLPGGTLGVTVSGDLAGVSAGPAGFYLMRLTNPQGPAMNGLFDTPGAAWSSVMVGAFVFVADGSSGLRVLDMAGHGGLAEVAAIESRGYARDVLVKGRLLLLADGAAGVRAFDISRPDRPLEIWSCDSGGDARNMALSGDLILVANGAAGMCILGPDGRSSSSVIPAQAGIHQDDGIDVIGRVGVGDVARGVDAAGDVAFLAASKEGLYIFDISEPARPIELGRFKPERAVNRVAVSKGRAYLANDSAGLVILDIKDPAHPVILGAGGAQY